MTTSIASPKTTQDFTISDTGEGYISRREVARLAGVHHSKIQRAVQKLSGALLCANTNENKQLSGALAYDLLLDCAEDGNVRALKSLRAIGQAGMRAYIYSAAGYTPEAPKQSNPMFECSLSNHDIYVWLATRKPSSIIRTLKLASQRCRGTALESQCWYDGMWHVSPAFLLAAPFTGTEMFRLNAKLCERAGLLGVDKITPAFIVNANFGVIV